MNSREFIYDVKNWYRSGRGRELQFFATDEEMQDWLLKFLPAEYSPYSLIGGYLTKKEGDKVYVQEPFEYSIGELSHGLYGGQKTHYNFWIRSMQISQQIKLSRGDDINRILSHNGLILLQHGLDIKNLGRDASRIAIVDKIKNEKTGEVVKHKEYLKIFNILARQIKKHLCYSTFWKFKDGSEREDFKLQLMTEKAVGAYKAGFKFKNRPGRRLNRGKMPMLID